MAEKWMESPPHEVGKNTLIWVRVASGQILPGVVEFLGTESHGNTIEANWAIKYEGRSLDLSTIEYQVRLPEEAAPEN